MLQSKTTVFVELVCKWDNRVIPNVLWADPDQNIAEIAITDANGCFIRQGDTILRGIIRGDFFLTPKKGQ